MCMLADCGVLRMSLDYTEPFFTFSAPLMRQLVIWQIQPIRGVTALHSYELTHLSLIDVVKQIITDMDSSTLLHPQAQKQCVINRHGGTGKFPSEFAFQAEFYVTLRLAIREAGVECGMKNTWLALLEAKSGAKRADLLIINGRRMVIEFKSGVAYSDGTNFYCF